MEKKDRWCIIKHVKQTSPELPVLRVIVVDQQCEVLEFDSHKEATEMKDIFEINSDSKHKYEVKKI